MGGSLGAGRESFVGFLGGGPLGVQWETYMGGVNRAEGGQYGTQINKTIKDKINPITLNENWLRITIVYLHTIDNIMNT